MMISANMVSCVPFQVSAYRGNEPVLQNRLEYLSNLISNWTREAVERGEPLLIQEQERVFNQLRLGLCALLLGHNQNPCGFATTYESGQNDGLQWWELGSVFVPPEYRDRKLGFEIYRAISVLHPTGVLVHTTKNPKVVHIANVLGFVTLSYVDLPHTVRVPLCYEASCFDQCGDNSCRLEHNLEGPCVTQVRWPLFH
ncbi:MAG: hypothetical protein GF349_00335 [Candidatus Magasanikbacteria bacterium]|nr:hypothetical protein [Candidatus Magasanikbacteria bacterium]